jgi:hypothetical protein
LDQRFGKLLDIDVFDRFDRLIVRILNIPTNALTAVVM